MKKEPTTDSEYEEALESWGVEFLDWGDGSFGARAKEGGITDLEASDLSGALFEAYHHFKP